MARKITASLQVDRLSRAGALEAAGALSEEDRLHATTALAIGQALYRASTGGREGAVIIESHVCTTPGAATAETAPARINA